MAKAVGTATPSPVGTATPSPAAQPRISGQRCYSESSLSTPSALSLDEIEDPNILALVPRRWTPAKVAARLGMSLGLGALLLLLTYPRLRHGPNGADKCGLPFDAWTMEGHYMRAVPVVAKALASWAFAWVSLVHHRQPTSSKRFIRALRLWLLLGYAISLMKISYHMCYWCEGDSSLRVRWLCVYQSIACMVAWICWTLGMTMLLCMRVAELEAAQGTGEWSQRMARYVAKPAQAVPVLMVVAVSFSLTSIEYARHLAVIFILALSVLCLITVAGVIMALRAFGVALSLAKASASTWAGRLRDARLGLLTTARWHLRLLVLCSATTVVYIGFYIADTVSALSVPASEDIWRSYVPSTDSELVPILREVAGCVDVITNELALLALSGLVRCRLRLPWARSRAARGLRDSVHGWLTGSTEWDGKVLELSRRGVTVEKLLDFYNTLGRTRMAHFDSRCHKTAHVVRQAIVPASADSKFGPCAMATILMEGESTPAQRMVTHCWDSLFVDLVSVVVADALGLRSYRGLSSWLKGSRIEALKKHLRRAGTLHKSYWICAFSVNQHSCTCSGGKVDLDPVLGCEEPRCDCGLAKSWNDTPPLNAQGQSCPCEVNKFDDMMTLLAGEDPNFAQVIAVDRSLVLFQRAWCMAELFAAHACTMDQVVVAFSSESLYARRSELENLRVEDMRASREEDKQMILAKIGDPAKFNEALRDMVLDEDTGLLAQRCDAIGTARTVGHLAKRGLGAGAASGAQAPTSFGRPRQ